MPLPQPKQNGSLCLMRFIHLLGLCSALHMSACGQLPERTVDAKVVSIVSSKSRFNNDRFVVTAQDETGLSGKKSVKKLELDCWVGDVVKATVRGISLTLDNSACVRG